jgi:hypothetical protein
VGFRFAEQFGPDYAAQRAEIERLARVGQIRRDAMLKARALQMLIIEPNGKPRRGEPERIARDLTVPIKRVRGWIHDVQGQVDYLTDSTRVSSAFAWAQLKKVWNPQNSLSWVTVERGIQRSLAGHHAGSGKRRRSGW